MWQNQRNGPAATGGDVIAEAQVAAETAADALRAVENERAAGGVFAETSQKEAAWRKAQQNVRDQRQVGN